MSLVVALALAAAPITAAPQPSDPVANLAEPRDGVRVALIERIAKSIARVKGVHDEGPPALSPDSGSAAMEKIRRKDTALFQRLTARPKPRPIQSEGSAFVYDDARSLLITAAHIIDKRDTITVFLADGSERPGTLVGADKHIGIAVIRVQGTVPAPLTLTSRKPRIGETMLAIGRLLPFDSVGATQGMLVGEARGDMRNIETSPALVDYLMLDNLLPMGGIGGGPVVNMRGEVVGIISAIWGQGYGQASATMAVPIADLRPQIEQLIQYGRIARSQIGLNLDCETEKCRIVSIVPGGPADTAGLKPDDILNAANGIKTNSVNAFRRQILTIPPGSDIALSINRGGVPLELKATSVSEIANGQDSAEPFGGPSATDLPEGL